MSSAQKPIKFAYHFHPVGQGLFASGFINHQYDKHPSFVWVYDCGTSSERELIHKEISYLKHITKNRNKIDLLTLSHFDQDHINGVVELIKQFEIGTIILPYMPLEERVMVACETQKDDSVSSLDNFYINPAKFLLNIENSNIDKIIFVPKSEGISLEPENIQEDDSDSGNQLRYEKDDIRGDQDKEQLHDTSDSNNLKKVNFLMPGSSITVIGKQWEFVPYNDPSYKGEINDAFIALIKKEKKKLLAPDHVEESLNNIKSAYLKKFKSNNRNIISLFLYSGPIYSKQKHYFLLHDSKYSRDERLRLYCWDFHHLFCCEYSYQRSIGATPCSILYTGDGSLETPDQLKSLITSLGKDRIKNTGVLQVMHHGSVKNWHEGVAERISPVVSIFSSDPKRKGYKHPSPDVLRDFWSYGATQVDKCKSYTAFGTIEFKKPQELEPDLS